MHQQLRQINQQIDRQINAKSVFGIIVHSIENVIQKIENYFNNINTAPIETNNNNQEQIYHHTHHHRHHHHVHHSHLRQHALVLLTMKQVIELAKQTKQIRVILFSILINRKNNNDLLSIH